MGELSGFLRDYPMSAPGNRIEADPTEAIVLGDTIWDAQASRRAGVPTAAVLSGGIARQANSFGGNDFRGLAVRPSVQTAARPAQICARCPRRGRL
jgi:hypothetical protein